jgi:hypothetical protein
LPCICSLSCAAADFAVHGFFAVRSSHTLPCGSSLPCVLLSTHGKDFFAVQRRTAMFGCTAMPFFPVVLVLDLLDGIG